MNNFIFEDINESTIGDILKLGDFFYWFDMNTGEILFKTKYNCKEFTHYCKEFAFFIGNSVYITDKYGNKLFETELEQFYKFKETQDKLLKIFEKTKCEVLKDNNYSYVHKCLYDKKDYFIVKKNGLYALVDNKNHSLIDFKYSFLCENHFEKIDKLLFIAQNSQSKLFGIIDIKENAIVPFIYDNIYFWNIYYNSEKIGVEKNNKSAIIDLNNNILIDFKYKYILDTMERYKYSFAQAENGLWGMIDRKGHSIKFDLSQVKEVNVKSLKRKFNTNNISYNLKNLIAFNKKDSLFYSSHKKVKNIKHRAVKLNNNQLKLKLKYT